MSEIFKQLLGDELLSSSGLKPTSEALKGKTVGLYFSAHWCPPCRGFTPKLADFYKTSLQQKGLEVVFISSDSDEESFKEYFESQPWLALPYSQRDMKAKLSRKFKVQGIPTFVILNSDGDVVTSDGRSAVMKDPTGEEFPWAPKPFSEVLGQTFLGPEKAKLDRSAVEGKVLGLYFSAHWCPPCRAFTPQLIEWYKKISPNLPDFQIVFVSGDNSEKEFEEYFEDMPWIAVPYEDRARGESLNELFEVQGIPSFVIVDKDGTVINKKARGLVQKDPTGKEFPWYPSPVKNIAMELDGLNEVPSLVVFADGADEESVAAVHSALLPIAKEMEAKAKTSGEPKLLFFVAGLEEAVGVLSEIRRRCNMPAVLRKHKHPLKKVDPEDGWYCDGCKSKEGTRWNCEECNFDFCDSCNDKATATAEPISGVIIDVSSKGFHAVPETDFTSTESVRTLVDKFLAGSLARTPFQVKKDEDDEED